VIVVAIANASVRTWLSLLQQVERGRRAVVAPPRAIRVAPAGKEGLSLWNSRDPPGNTLQAEVNYLRGCQD